MAVEESKLITDIATPRDTGPFKLVTTSLLSSLAAEAIFKMFSATSWEFHSTVET